ncbi:hypothetical protein SteCoe_21920 [Stentor coeruleus]|uniref:Uncharacterized protein n=1 Tax=Stentor coeruleus TaxID=5963 RepID=A0A1R2BNF4_9CILI|nr:hypothetical protein SteCoe_21920 [Stentor coeruleus]
MEGISYQETYKEITEELEYLTSIPIILGLLLLCSLFKHKSSVSSWELIRITIPILYLYTAIIYCSWPLAFVHLFYALLFIPNFELLAIGDLSSSILYFFYSYSPMTLCLSCLLLFTMAAPDSNSFPAPYILSSFTFTIVNRLKLIFRRQSDRESLDIHFLLLKYIPCFISIGHFVIFAYYDNKFYIDHIVCAAVFLVSFKQEEHFIEIKEHVQMPVKKPKKIEYEQVFELRPELDGGKQGISPLPYYMDDDGDVANEFYEEVGRKFVKIHESRLKKV